MKHFLFLGLLFCMSLLQAQNSTHNIIPSPVQFTEQPGVFTINATTKITDNANYSSKELNSKLTSILNTPTLLTSGEAQIQFRLVNDLRLGKEGYHLQVMPNRILIEAATELGHFYAVQTLFQLMPPNTYSGKPEKASSLSIPCCSIVDYPRFGYRGMHLDVCRHFFSVEFVKHYIDLLAMHKINFFHWHLTDDQGWRIEIKKYPKLAEIASKRKETLIGHYTSNQGYDGKPYGGYYTQEQIREVVAYALTKHVTIIPEIEMPGHAQAALSAYPEYSCTGGPFEAACTWGVMDEVFCPTEATFTFLENVLDEVVALFPYSPYIHIGGDECPKTRWKACPKCQALIKKEGLKDEHELQSYFTNRITKYLISKGKQVIGWDEVLEGGVPDDVIVMSWQGEKGGLDAAKANHYAIMTPSGFLYLNYYQGKPEDEPVAIGGFATLSKVYHYEPVPKELPQDKAHFIMGLQGCLWTEYISDPKLVEYMVYPRLSAVAETGWTPKEQKDYTDFENRLTTQFLRYDAMGVNYSKSHYNIRAKTSWNMTADKPQVALETDCKDCEIRYTTNGSVPNVKSNLYTSPILLLKKTNLKAVALKNGEPFSSIYTEELIMSKSTGKSYVMPNVNPQYTGGHPLALTDGIASSEKSWDKWVGTLGNDMDVTIDLDQATDIKKVSTQFLHSPDSWIFAPEEVSLMLSQDGTNWQTVETQKITDAKKGLLNVSFAVNKVKARYVKLFAKSIIKLPEGHPGAGYDAHLFCNEIVVE